MPRNVDRHILAIERVLDAIEDNLRRPLDVEQLAREHGLSYWHFQRVFTACAGEPVGSYIRRRRLSAAARELLRSRRRILDLAMDYQFDSHESFTRAFRTMFGLSPDRFRRDPISLWSARPRLTAERLSHLRRLELQPTLIELPPLHLLGISTRFIGFASDHMNSTTVLPRLWDEFRPRIGEISQRADPYRYGAWTNVPREERSDPDEFVYLAGLAVTPPVAAPGDMVMWSAPAARYARFTHRGTVRRIGETINFIYAAWLPRSGYARGEGFDIEFHDHRFSLDGEHSELDYYVPLAG